MVIKGRRRKWRRRRGEEEEKRRRGGGEINQKGENGGERKRDELGRRRTRVKAGGAVLSSE